MAVVFIPVCLTLKPVSDYMKKKHLGKLSYLWKLLWNCALEHETSWCRVKAPAHIPNKGFQMGRRGVYLASFLWLCAGCVRQVCGSAEKALFTTTGTCLCCCVRPFSSRTEPGFFSSLVLNEGLAVFPWLHQTLLPSCLPSPSHLFLPLPLFHPQKRGRLPHGRLVSLHRGACSVSPLSLSVALDFILNSVYCS